MARPELIIRNRAIIYRRKQNLAIRYLGRHGNKLVTADVAIGFPPLGDTGRHETPRLCTIFHRITRTITYRRKWHDPVRQASDQC